MQLVLPPALEPFRDQLMSTRTTFVRAKARKMRQTSPSESKVGGIPYWPKALEWPVGTDGAPLFFLAQINFSEIPPLSPFPNTGIVQFFIGADDLYGMDFDDGEKQDTFRVIYHPEVNPNAVLTTRLSEAAFDEDFLPHHPDESYPLTFSLEEEVVPVTDYRFYDYFGGDFFRQFGEQEWQIQEDFSKKVRSDGHKLGGYAYFTQDDPRRADDPMLLLLQLDSDEVMDLMWGDMGVGHFFIRETDLLRCDFSKVLYDWDCL